jgi:pimeloyl-ACP methyl ester carboxylesterase
MRRGAPERPDAHLTSVRANGSDAAVLFLHGFASSGSPFGRFPERLADEPALADWDLHLIGYNTGFGPDLERVWATDPSIELLAGYLRTRLRLDPLDDYTGIAIVAHSMGGLVAQEALLADAELADRVSHLFCFGTPSGGLRSARWGGFLKRQVSDMAAGGEFIDSLRTRWEERFGAARPFDLWVVAGDRDAFVPASSSLDPFPPEVQLVVPGDHLEIVDVQAKGSMSEQIVVEGLVGNAAPAGPWNAARVAVEQREFDRAVRELLPNVAELDEAHLVDLALALEATGRREEAVEVLREHAGRHSTDAKGTLAGRLKRNWQTEGIEADGEAAHRLYAEGLASAESAGNHDQAYYHAINVAFMELAFGADRAAARRAAKQALEHCAAAPAGYWRSATEGEAHLYLEAWPEALAAYRQAVGFNPSPREIESTYRQAVALAAQLGASPRRREELEAIFR